MKNRLLFLLILALCLSLNLAIAQTTSKSPSSRILQKSELPLKSYSIVVGTSYPVPFTATNNPTDSLAVSTGYYFVDNFNETAAYPWQVTPEWFSDLTTMPNLWTRIQPGPNCVTPAYWTAHPEQGVSYLRNPALSSDTTLAAFAGPIPIGFNFFYNGIRYDSFYVSIRGLIGLSNRRYFYDAAGNRTVPSGSTTGAYDPMSDDWFDASRPRDTTNNYLNSLTDPTPDNYGYNNMACGGTPATNNTGIRKIPNSNGNAEKLSPPVLAHTSLQTIFGKFPIIAPLYATTAGGSFHLSQISNTPPPAKKDDYGRMYYRRSPNGDKLTVYVVNTMPVGNFYYTTSPNPVSYTVNNRPNASYGNYMSCSYQVTLNKIDSSITMNYKMTGVTTVNGTSYTVGSIFQKNCMVGLNGRARARTTDSTAKSPWLYEYSQSTMQNDGFYSNTVQINDGFAIKFKQWKNTGRLLTKELWARSTNLSDQSLAYNTKMTDSKITSFYELLAGHERLGSVQPVVVIQNMCNDRQGRYGQAVNSTPQNLQMRVISKAMNAATKEFVYYQMMNVDSSTLHLLDDSAHNDNVHGSKYAKVRFCDAAGNIQNDTLPAYKNLNGIKPYGFCKVYFKPFEPSDLQQKNIGTMILTFSIDPRNPKTNIAYAEEWPFDDSLSSSIFVMQKLDGFNDDFSVFNSLDGNPAPSMLKWVNYYAELSDGEQNNYNPLLPRGEFAATNDKDITMKSPCVLMNRKMSAGSDLVNAGDPPDGDELRSFPIDLVAAKNSNLLRTFAPTISVSVQRGDRKNADGYVGNYVGTFCESQHVGPEQRIVKYSVPQNFSDTRADGGSNNVADRITIQYAMPSPDGITNITNITNWGKIPTSTSDKTGTACFAYVLYGGGGKTLGFKDGDRETPVLYNSGADNNGTPQLGFVPDLFDDGMDYEFKKMVAPIPKAIYNYQSNGGSTFRFMIKVLANHNQNSGLNPIDDDDDDFYIDNVRINMFSGIADLELSSIKVSTHYTMVPASQTTAIPIVAYVSNNTLDASPLFVIQGRIYQGGPNPLGNNRFLYCRTLSVPFIKGADQQYYSLPAFNARDAAAGATSAQFVIEGTVFVTGGDQYFENNTNYSQYAYKADSVIAYDAPTATGKNWVSDVNGSNSTGISMPLTNVYNDLGTYDYFQSVPNRGYAGQIAIKAELFTPDTVQGYRAWFGGYQQGLDQVTFRIYNDNNGVPGTMVANSRLVKQRGMGRAEVAAEAPTFDAYIDYYYDDNPVALNAGTYWFAISQDAETCLELGGHLSRLGARVTVVDANYSHERALFVDKTLRTFDTKGQRINYDYVAYQNSTGDGAWVRYMKTDTLWGLWHADYKGSLANNSANPRIASYSYVRAAYAPDLRINFGTRLGQTTAKTYVDCTVPVELSQFDGNVRNKGVDLYWTTESEVDNAGFNIERRELINGSNYSDWQTIKFETGQGFSAAPTNYSIYDNNVAYNKTYQYRLRQVDKDGTISCDNFSKTLEFKIGGEDNVTLKLTTKNPFDHTIGFSFSITNSGATSLDIVDIYGNVVKTVINGDLSAGDYEDYYWDGTNSNGSSVANGAYFLRLTSNSTTKTLKMSLLK